MLHVSTSRCAIIDPRDVRIIALDRSMLWHIIHNNPFEEVIVLSLCDIDDSDKADKGVSEKA